MSTLTQAEKFELGRKVRANGDIREGDRLLFDAALDHYSCKTGRCDPSATTLGKAVARNERTARRRLERLQGHGVLRLIKRKGCSTLIELPHPNLLATPDNYVSGPVIHNPGQMEQEPRTNGVTTPDTILSDEPGTSKSEEKRHSGKGNGSAQASAQSERDISLRFWQNRLDTCTDPEKRERYEQHIAALRDDDHAPNGRNDAAMAETRKANTKGTPTP